MAAGLDPARLILAPRAAPDRYRARLALADLFLDTFPYNAGTVASDALRAGLPVLTRRGRAFASRMAASLLEAVELGGLITSDDMAYKDLAIQLATDRQGVLKAARAHLATGAWARTIGDTVHFTRRLERALESVWHATSGGAVRLGSDGIWSDETEAR
jgi:predicted O-linked N-acetylglucosamine transferase (SPINDLY family)